MEVGPPRLQYTRTNYRSGPGWFPLTSSHPRGKDSHRQGRITGGRVGRFGFAPRGAAVLSGGTLPSTRPAPPFPGEAERVSTDSKILEYVSSVLDVSRRGTVERRSGNPEFVRFVWYGRGYAALEEQRDVERVSKEFVISTRSSSRNCPFTSKNSSQCSLDIPVPLRSTRQCPREAYLKRAKASLRRSVPVSSPEDGRRRGDRVRQEPRNDRIGRRSWRVLGISRIHYEHDSQGWPARGEDYPVYG